VHGTLEGSGRRCSKSGPDTDRVSKHLCGCMGGGDMAAVCVDVWVGGWQMAIKQPCVCGGGGGGGG
jgi:hypothetical protein